MMEFEAVAAALLGGFVTSAAPCALAAVPVAIGYVGGEATTPRRAWVLSLAFVAGMNLALLVLGLLAARIGILLGSLPGHWSAFVGSIVASLGAWMWASRQPGCSLRVPARLERRLASSGLPGATLLGALTGTVMSPCATPALAAALAVAGAGALFGNSTAWGVALLLAYGVGHSVLLLVAGALPAAGVILRQRFASVEAWWPGRRAFGVVLVAVGLWWVMQGLDLLPP